MHVRSVFYYKRIYTWENNRFTINSQNMVFLCMYCDCQLQSKSFMTYIYIHTIIKPASSQQEWCNQSSLNDVFSILPRLVRPDMTINHALKYSVIGSILKKMSIGVQCPTSYIHNNKPKDNNFKRKS